MREKPTRRQLLAYVGSAAIVLGSLREAVSPVVGQGTGSPTADFSYSPSTPVPDEDVTFDGTLSSDPDGDITEYDWTIEQESVYDENYTSARPAHAWGTGGNFEVTLEVTDDTGATDSITRTIEIDNSAPIADFSFSPTSPVPDESVAFDGTISSDPDGEITEYEWTVEQESVYDEDYSSAQPFHTWGTGGSFDVTLEVSDNGDETDSVTKTVDVDNSSPTADFSYSPTSPVPDEDVTFDGTLSDDSDGDISSYEWTVEQESVYDEDYSSAQPIHTWGTGGSFDVTLEVTDNGGATGSVTKTIEIDNSTPSPDFSYSPSPPLPDESVTLDGTLSSDPDGEITGYEWTVEQESVYDEDYSSAQPTHTWDAEGSYDVTLEVTDNGDATDSVTKTVDVGNDPPTADFSYSPSPPLSNQEVALDGTGSDDPEGEIVEYIWEIETVDGATTSRSDPRPSHSWDTVGDYQIALEVADNRGLTDRVSQTISVGGEPPNAEITYTPSSPTTAQTVTFDGTSSADPDGAIEEYRWKVDGEVVSSDPAFERQFEAEERFRVVLQITDSGGRTDSASRTVAIEKERDDSGNNGESPASSETDSADGDSSGGDDDSMVPLGLGIGGLGIGAVVWYLRNWNDATGPDVEELRESASELAEEADENREANRYERAVSLYEESIQQYETAVETLEAIEATETAAIAEAASEARTARDETREKLERLEAVREPLQKAERTFLTAVARHAQNQRVPARRDYREAKNQYGEALTALNEGEIDVFNEAGSITIPVAIETNPLPDEIADWRSISKADVDLLSKAGMTTIADIKALGEENVAESIDEGSVGGKLYDRLLAASWWREGDVTFESAGAIERRRDRAERGQQLLL